MKRGYIQGSDTKKKRRTIVEAGVPDDKYLIYKDGMPPQHRSKDWRHDFPEKKNAIADLRLGDELVVYSITDFGLQKGEATMLIAEVSMMGASVLDASTGKYYRFAQKEAEDIIELWKVSGKAWFKRSREKANKTMKRLGISRGDKGILAPIKKTNPELYAEIERIWCTAKTAPIAKDEIDSLLSGDMTVSRASLQRHFGYIKAAQKAYAERLNKDQ